MKYSQTIGILSALLLLAACFFPWSYIESRQITVTGISAPGTSYGKPGLMNIILCCVSILCFAIPAIWAKRTNVFITAFNLAWSVRNCLLLSACMMGECPQRKPALLVSAGLSVVILFMSFLPRIRINE